MLCLALLCSNSAQAGTASKIVDKTIEFTARTAYYATKYALKGGWFITRKTAQGIKIITLSVFDAAGDTFKEEKKKPVKTKAPEYYEDNGTLPPPPPILD